MDVKGQEITSLLFSLADIDDLKVCYVLKDGDNATSDIFHFSVEDNGKFLFSYFIQNVMNYNLAYVKDPFINCMTHTLLYHRFSKSIK